MSFLSRTGASRLIPGPLGVRVGKLVGQHSDSSRVSQLLQTPSRESKKLKLVQEKREKRENPIASGQQEKGEELTRR